MDYFSLGLRQKENLRRKNISYVNQLEELNSIESSLKNLIDFIDTQKTKLKETEDTIIRLRKEKEKIEPVLEVGRETIGTILELQKEGMKKKIWKERIIVFILGILASLFAATLIILVKFIFLKKSSVS